MSGPSTPSLEPIESKAQLVAYLEAGNKPREDWRIGTEHEKFAFRLDDRARLPHDGKDGIGRLLSGLTRFGWTLVKEGEAVQARAGKAASAQMTRLGKTATGSWDKLEQVFEERVSKSLNRLGVPTYGDIQALNRHVSELNTNVRQLIKESKGKAPSARKRAAKPGKDASAAA